MADPPRSFNPYYVLLARVGPTGLPACVGDIPGRGAVVTYALADDRATLEPVGSGEAINPWPDALSPGSWVTLGGMMDYTMVVLGYPLGSPEEA